CFGGEFGFAVELDRGGDVGVFLDGVAEGGGPEAVGGDEDEGLDAGGECGFREEASGVDVRGPEKLLVQLHSVGELRGHVEDGCKPMGDKERLKQCGIADVALNAGEAGV